jgi:hypothetical protein
MKGVAGEEGEAVRREVERRRRLSERMKGERSMWS